jgi:hypothetical protein
MEGTATTPPQGPGPGVQPLFEEDQAQQYAYPAAESSESGATLRLRGLPFSAGADDVRAFFAASGFAPTEIFLCRRNGAQRALSRRLTGGRVTD